MATRKIRLLRGKEAPAAGERVTLVDASGSALTLLFSDDKGVIDVPVNGAEEVAFRIGTSSEVVRLEGDELQPREDPLEITIPPHERGLVQLYGQLVDREGQPAGGVGMAIVRDSDNAVLAHSVSDTNGAFVLAYRARPDAKGKFELRLSVNKAPIPVPNLLEVGEGLRGPFKFVVDRRPPQKGRVAPSPVLIGKEDEILSAFTEAPDIFSRPVGARVPSACSPYAGPDVATRVFYLNQFAMFTPPPAGEAEVAMRARAWERAARAVRAVSAPVSFTDGVAAPREQGLRYGALLEFRQEWWDLGYALGDLLYSVPLAPCEQTKIAAVDWRRRDYAKQRTALDERHFQDTTISRDEVINETVRMSSEKGITGTTEGGGLGASLGILSGGWAKSVENIDETVEASTDATRNINDRIQQSSNTLRNTRSFAVVEAIEEEESVVRTRTVRNHNHCHTVTFQYFEVIRRFLLATRLSKVRPAVFIPFNLMTFDAATVSRYGYLLRRALLDTTLEPVLDRILGRRQPAAVAQPPSAVTTPVPEPEEEEGELPSAEATVTRFRLSGVVTSLPGALGAWSYGLGQPSEPTAEGPGRERHNPWPSNDLVFLVNGQALQNLQAAYSASMTAEVSMQGTLPSGVRISEIERIGLQSLRDNTFFVDDLVIEAEVDGEWRRLFFRPAVRVPQYSRWVELVAAAAVAETSEQGASAPAADSGLPRLIDHLNANRAYYTGAAIAGGDAGLRYLALSQFLDGQGKPLADIVENTVAGFIGNFAVFPLRSVTDLPPGLRASRNDWLKNPPEDRRLITLPTPGIFAESQLGACSACEKIDDTRFWDWQTSPCLDEAPDITEGMLASRYQDLSQLIQVVKSELEPSKLPIPEQPEPMIKVGDATLSELVKGLELQGPEQTLGFIQGLSQISADNFQAVVSALEKYFGSMSQTPAQPGGPGASTLSAGGLDGAAAGGGAEGAAAGGAAAGEALPATGAMML
jgi:hypothetical protein